MRKAIETLKNIWKIEDLRQRILITILFVAIYRFGSYVVLPGINPAMLAKLHEQTSDFHQPFQRRVDIKNRTFQPDFKAFAF